MLHVRLVDKRLTSETISSTLAENSKQSHFSQDINIETYEEEHYSKQDIDKIDYAERSIHETEDNSNNNPSELYSDKEYFKFDINFEQFFEMSHIQQIMFEASDLRVADVLLMIMSYCIRYSISNAARDGLIELVKVLAGPRFK